ncbi:MAG: NAD(P)H-dependent oxidoreductase [Burkholderiales bacterium]
MSTPRLLVFAGSLRAASLNRKLAALAAAGARRAGADVTCIDLRDYPLPIYDGDLEAASGIPANARALKDLFIAHQGFLIACPEYNAGVTAVLKNTIDWVSRQDGKESGTVPYEGKVVGLMGATPGQFATLRSQEAVRNSLMNLGCLVMPKRLALARAHEAFDDAGDLKDAVARVTLDAVIAQVIRVASSLA